MIHWYNTEKVALNIHISSNYSEKLKIYLQWSSLNLQQLNWIELKAAHNKYSSSIVEFVEWIEENCISFEYTSRAEPGVRPTDTLGI